MITVDTVMLLAEVVTKDRASCTASDMSAEFGALTVGAIPACTSARRRPLAASAIPAASHHTRHTSSRGHAFPDSMGLI